MNQNGQPCPFPIINLPRHSWPHCMLPNAILSSHLLFARLAGLFVLPWGGTARLAPCREECISWLKCAANDIVMAEIQSWHSTAEPESCLQKWRLSPLSQERLPWKAETQPKADELYSRLGAPRPRKPGYPFLASFQFFLLFRICRPIPIESRPIEWHLL